MLRTKNLLLAAIVVTVPLLSIPQAAEAGPLLDWLRGRHRPVLQTADYNTYASPQYADAANPAGLQPGQCMKTCQQTCSRTVVNYVPQTAYRTNWKQVPVTQYKPVTKSDPCTGCTVTCMRPCTTYTYQMQRVPYTTYRPVYRTETYKVPVTTITNNCATGNCATGTCGTSYATNAPAGCATCGNGDSANSTPSLGAVNYAPTTSSYIPQETVNGTRYEYPSSRSNSGGSTIYGDSYSTSGSAADSVPSLPGINPQSSARPVLDQLRSSQPAWNGGNQRQVDYPQTPTPAVMSYSEKTAMAPERREWNYSAVRLASYNSHEAATSGDSYGNAAPIQIRGTFKPTTPAAPARKLNGWVEVD